MLLKLLNLEKNSVHLPGKSSILVAFFLFSLYNHRRQSLVSAMLGSFIYSTLEKPLF